MARQPVDETCILPLPFLADCSKLISIHRPDAPLIRSVDLLGQVTPQMGESLPFCDYFIPWAPARPAGAISLELYAQDKGAQLLSVHCKSKPYYETGARPNNDGTSKAIVTRFSVTFPLVVRVLASNGNVWRLDINHNYAASNLDTPGKQKLSLNFGIVGQNAE